MVEWREPQVDCFIPAYVDGASPAAANNSQIVVERVRYDKPVCRNMFGAAVSSQKCPDIRPIKSAGRQLGS